MNIINTINMINNEEVTIPQMLKDTGKYDLPSFLINKINYLNNLNYKDSTKENFLRNFINYILPYEMYKGKDLYLFNEQEILIVMNNLNTSSVRVKKNLESLINGYLDYNIGIGAITKNIMTSILKDNDRKVDKEKLKNKYVSIDECFEMYDKALKKSDLTAQECIIILLARYSITSEEMICIHEDDINLKKGKVYIRNNENKIYRCISVDDRMISKLDEAIKTTECVKGGRKRLFINNGFLLKPALSGANTVNYGVIRNRLSQSMKMVDKEYITIKDLNKSYLIDRLIELNEVKGSLTNDDIKDVLVEVGREPNSSYFSLKEDLSMIRPDIKVVNGKSGKKSTASHK